MQRVSRRASALSRFLVAASESASFSGASRTWAVTAQVRCTCVSTSLPRSASQLGTEFVYPYSSVELLRGDMAGRTHAWCSPCHLGSSHVIARGTHTFSQWVLRDQKFCCSATFRMACAHDSGCGRGTRNHAFVHSGNGSVKNRHPSKARLLHIRHVRCHSLLRSLPSSL